MIRRWLLSLLILSGCTSEPKQDASRGPASALPPPATPAAAPRSSADPAPSSAPARAAEPKRPERYNVLLLLVDSMRADMPWAGYPRAVAPHLTALEKESVSYTRGYSVSSYTAKSVAAVLSGKYPSTLFRSAPFFTRYPDSNLFLAELLQAAGVYTASAHAHMYMRRGVGFDQGFDKWELVEGITFDNKTDNHVTSQKLTPLAIELLEAKPADRPFFMYLHYMDPHDVYVNHKEAEFGSKLRDRYDSEMFYTDLWIGKLLDYMKQKPWWDETVVIVSADHGEAFGEHDMHRHAFELWNVLTQVPLFFRIPGVPGRPIDTPRSHVDIAPTVLELMNNEAPNDFVGVSLVGELMGGEPKARPVLLELPADTNNPERRALISGDFKLLVFESGWRVDLYNLKDDPNETKNLAKEQPEKLAELKREFETEWAKYQRIKPFGGNQLRGGGTANGPMKPPDAPKPVGN
ncbi:MAG TPA: sulfatase [Polyangiaceae bacterium]|nr:sulfatase [Polyangiaceae bacterium]